MASAETVRELTRAFFQSYPDYFLCRTMAENVAEGVKSRTEALSDLAQKARASAQNSQQIEEMLNRKTITLGHGETVLLQQLKLREILDLDDQSLTEVVRFYCKHPYAHGRTRKSRLLPRWLRTFFLSALLGHAKNRSLDLDYGSCFELITLL